MTTAPALLNNRLTLFISSVQKQVRKADQTSIEIANKEATRLGIQYSVAIFPIFVEWSNIKTTKVIALFAPKTPQKSCTCHSFGLNSAPIQEALTQSEMSILVAAQSALFYYAACSPCIDVYEKRQRKKKAESDRREREKQPITEGYVHPVAMNTNPYWKQEMEIGPSLPRKKRSRAAIKTGSQRRLTAQTNSSMSMGTEASRTSAGNSPITERDRDASGDEGSKVPQQREDEELWGVHIREFERSPSFTSTQAETILSSDGLPETLEYQRLGHRLVDAVVKAGESAGRLIEAARSPLVSREVSDEERHNFYRSSIKSPPVNDFHPPVVSSRPMYADGNRWMLQPPPPAAVMEGRVPVSRSSSMASQVSSRKTVPVGAVSSLGRAVHERTLRKMDYSTISGAEAAAAETRKYWETRRSKRLQGGAISASASATSKISGRVKNPQMPAPKAVLLREESNDIESRAVPSRLKRRTLDQMSWSPPYEAGRVAVAPAKPRTVAPATGGLQVATPIQEVPTADEIPQGRDSGLGEDETPVATSGEIRGPESKPSPANLPEKQLHSP